METVYKSCYRIRAWTDERNVLNYEACTNQGTVLASGFDLCGTMTRDEAIKKMQQAVDSSREHTQVSVPLWRKIDRVRKSR